MINLIIKLLILVEALRALSTNKSDHSRLREEIQSSVFISLNAITVN